MYLLDLSILLHWYLEIISNKILCRLSKLKKDVYIFYFPNIQQLFLLKVYLKYIQRDRFLSKTNTICSYILYLFERNCVYWSTFVKFAMQWSKLLLKIMICFTNNNDIRFCIVFMSNLTTEYFLLIINKMQHFLSYCNFTVFAYFSVFFN